MLQISVIYTHHTLAQARLQVLTKKSMKVTVFWDAAPRSLVETDRRFRSAYCLHQQADLLLYLTKSFRALLTHRPDDGGRKHLWNVGKFLPNYTAQIPEDIFIPVAVRTSPFSTFGKTYSVGEGA
jgi:hypothetical protein